MPRKVLFAMLVCFCVSQEGQGQTALSPRNANYTIEVKLNPAAKTLDGTEVIEWRNITEAPASELQFHVYWNAWKNNRSTWMRERGLDGTKLEDVRPEDWGWADVRSIKIGGNEVQAQRKYISPDDGNSEDQTVMAVPLPAPVGPGQSVKVEVQWHSKIPRTFRRTGYRGDYFFIAQWFPKLGVWQANGAEGRWNCHQFHLATEFFSDYGVYDVQITVPASYVVGATGVALGRTENGSLATHRYLQEDVHDFAWTTSPDYMERTARFEHPKLKPVDMRLLIMPEHVSQAERHFAATRATLEYYGTWYGAYPYGHITVIDPAYGSGAGGMEYPTLFTAGTRWLNPQGGGSPEGVTVHEAGHQFWYGIVGSNEFEDAWLDEGFNTFSTARAIDAAFGESSYVRRYFKGFIPYMFDEVKVHRITNGNRLDGYRAAATADMQATPTYLYFPATASPVTYNKTALWLNTLERMLGSDTVQKIMATYFERWKFKHPGPDDFFAIVNEVAGKDMTWFFDQVHRSSDKFDYGIEAVRSEAAGPDGFAGEGTNIKATEKKKDLFISTVIVRRYGEAIFPVDIEVAFENGEKVVEPWSGRDRWKAFTYEKNSKARHAVVDPNRVLLLDVNYTNNSRLREPQNTFPALKWASRWMIWLQDLMATFAFFA